VAAIVLSNVGPGTATSADVLGEHVRARLSGQPAVSLAEVSIPAIGGIRAGIRLLTAYWLTMVAAGVFIFGLAMTAQGLAASWLPRRHFLRMSSWLQVGAFCLIVVCTVFSRLLGVVGIAWIGVRGRTAWLGHATGTQPEFEDEPTRVLTLDVWDSRFTPSSPNLTPTSPPLPTQHRRDV
jgi:hypothetical protein